MHQKPATTHHRTPHLDADDSGASAVEYGLIVGLVAIAIAVTAGVFGEDLAALYHSSHESVAAVAAAAAGTG